MGQKKKEMEPITDKAWNQIKQSKIENCFRKASFKSVSVIEKSTKEMNTILNTVEQLVDDIW